MASSLSRTVATRVLQPLSRTAGIFPRSTLFLAQTTSLLSPSPLSLSPLHRSKSTATVQTPTTSPPLQFNTNLKPGRQGDEYILTKQQIQDYHTKGYIVVTGVLSEEELKPLEEIYMRFMNREIHVPNKDLCDMSGDFSRKFEDFNIINAMLPRKYYPALKNNIYEKRAKSITRQLFSSNDFDIDYDQLLAKKPSKKDAVFAWHCDMAYWPKTPDTRTATFSLAIDPTTKANGCLRFVDGSHLSQTIRPHKPISGDREKGHTIACDVNERTPTNPNGELVTYCEVGRGDATVHNEYVVHGSGGNFTQGWRRTYVIATRHKNTIQMEREAGFSHSHNDEVNWDTFNLWQKK